MCGEGHRGGGLGQSDGAVVTAPWVCRRVVSGADGACGVGVGGGVGGSVAGRKRGTGTVLSGYARFWMALAVCLVMTGLSRATARRLPSTASWAGGALVGVGSTGVVCCMPCCMPCCYAKLPCLTERSER